MRRVQVRSLAGNSKPGALLERCRAFAFQRAFPGGNQTGNAQQPDESGSVLADGSNRGHNSLAVFCIGDSTGALTLEQVVLSDGDQPSPFSLDPKRRWLLVANQGSGAVVVLARDREVAG